VNSRPSGDFRLVQATLCVPCCCREILCSIRSDTNTHSYSNAEAAPTSASSPNTAAIISDLARILFCFDRAKRSCYTNAVTFRFISQILIMAFLVAGCAEVSHAALFSDGFVVYVSDRPYPSDFDPYYNQPKIYRQPRYYEYTSKKRKGNKVFKTTKVKDQYGRTVYKKTTSHKKKKR
jgi:hypothetical protein